MASTNKTPRLGLSQWVLSDPFRMEDFNQDNAKIDDGFKAVDQRFTDMSANMNTALAPLALVKIGEVITSQSCQQIDLDVSGIEWDRYFAVSFFWLLKFTRLSDDRAYCRMRANRLASTNNYYYRSIPGGASTSTLDSICKLNAVKGTYGLTDHYCVSSLFPQFDAAYFYTKDISFNAYDNYDAGGIVKTSESNSTPMPLSSLQTLNFSAFNNSTSTPGDLTLLPGSTIKIYGVRR